MRLPQTRIEMNIAAPPARRQRGQTIALVAVSMVSLLAMAALTIDLTTLYVARGEIQRAADTTALAGAKAFVDSGVTSDSSRQTLAQSLANAYAIAAVGQNNVGGAPAQMVGQPVVNFGFPGNPRVTVRLQKSNLPVFFARIWGNSAAAVAATATAEAYNPASSQTNTTTFIPAAPKCVKPFLVPNNDTSGQPVFVTPGTGAVNGSIQVLGQPISLSSACKPGNPSVCAGQGPGNTPIALITSSPAPFAGDYLPLLVGSTHQYCPNSGSTGCSGGGSTDFEQSVRCCDGTPFDFAQCGTTVNLASWDQNLNPGGPSRPTQQGLQCLVHSPQQDTLAATNYAANSGPLQISPGAFSQNRYNVGANTFIATSDSIITVPLFESNTSGVQPQVKIIGFLQLFVSDVGGPARTDFNAYILNVVGCGNNPAPGAPVSGGGVSAIPVRLIHN
jgi:Putative Flp pilus-assembly TadE/G-like